MSGMALAAMAKDDRSSDFGSMMLVKLVLMLLGQVMNMTVLRNLAGIMTQSRPADLTVGVLAALRWRCVAGSGVSRTSRRGVGRLRAFAPHSEGALRPRLVPLWGVARLRAFAPRNEGALRPHDGRGRGVVRLLAFAARSESALRPRLGAALPRTLAIWAEAVLATAACTARTTPPEWILATCTYAAAMSSMITARLATT